MSTSSCAGVYDGRHYPRDGAFDTCVPSRREATELWPDPAELARLPEDFLPSHVVIDVPETEQAPSPFFSVMSESLDRASRCRAGREGRTLEFFPRSGLNRWFT